MTPAPKHANTRAIGRRLCGHSSKMIRVLARRTDAETVTPMVVARLGGRDQVSAGERVDSDVYDPG